VRADHTEYEIDTLVDALAALRMQPA